MGAKSPLATGVESYRVTSRYNGKEFCFDIYSHKVDCVYGLWNDDGSKNEHYDFQTVMVQDGDETVEEEYVVDGEVLYRSVPKMVPYKAYYKETTLKNAVIISIEVRKHNRNQYFDAVKSQLMYLKDDIQFFEQYLKEPIAEVPFKANIIFEDDNIVMSDYNYYARPHFVIKNVGYGLIDFNELDLSPKFGNIGIKVKMEDINVTPSRETVIYSTKTREAVLKQYDKVSQIVEEAVQKSLDQDNFLDWIKACNDVMYTTGNTVNVISRLSALIDKSSLKPKFKGTDIAFNSDVKQFITPLLSMTQNVLQNTYSYQKSKQVKKMAKEEVTNIIGFNKPLYLQFRPGNSRVSTYLANINTHGFCTIRTATNVKYLEEAFGKYAEGKLNRVQFFSEVHGLFDEHETDVKKISNLKEMLVKTTDFIDALLASDGEQKLNWYTESLVPDGFVVQEDEDEEVESNFEEVLEQVQKETYEDVLKRRRENKAFIGNLMINKRKTAYSYLPGFERKEINLADLDYESTSILYGTDDDINTFNLLMEIERSAPNAKTNESKYFYWNDDIKILKVAKSNLRFVKKATPIRDYLISVDDTGTLLSCPAMKNIFTAHAINETIRGRCNFMTNFGEFSQEVSTTYKQLFDFVQNQASMEALQKFDTDEVKTLIASYNVQLQLLQHTSIDEDDKQDLIDKHIPTTLDLDIINIDLIDLDLYNKAIKLASFADVYGSILSYIDILQDIEQPILQTDLVMELRSIIDSRTDQLEFKYENIN